MTIYVSSASHDENSKYSGGAAGDQTGTEVYIRSFYMHSKGWVILRPKSVAIANKVASGGKDLANNDNVGYDQNQRGTLLTQYKKYGSIAKIATKCECDCSSSTRVVVYQATGKDPGDFTTANEKSVLLATGYFEEKTCSSSADVYNGDILVTKTKGHTVIVTSGRPRPTTTTVTYFKKYTGKSNSLVDALKAIGATSTLAYRKKIAVKNGIVSSESKYTGQATYNTKMLSLLKKGTLIKP